MPRIRFRPRLPRRSIHWFLLCAGLLTAARLWDRLQRPVREFDFQSTGPYRVAGVENGDTLLLEGNVPLRLIGVDGRHSQPLANTQAVAFLRRRVESRDVTLEFDRERVDHDGRPVAYVYVDGSLLNEELIRAGFARADATLNIDRSMAKRLRGAEEEGREAKRGIGQGQTVTALKPITSGP
jgi:endonuclease YncB( thermonuclease family)